MEQARHLKPSGCDPADAAGASLRRAIAVKELSFLLVTLGCLVLVVGMLLIHP